VLIRPRFSAFRVVRLAFATGHAIAATRQVMPPASGVVAGDTTVQRPELADFMESGYEWPA
jgi:hypothetical protein